MPAPDEPLVPAPEEPLVPAPDEPLVPAPDEPPVPAPDEPLVPAAPAAPVSDFFDFALFFDFRFLVVFLSSGAASLDDAPGLPEAPEVDVSGEDCLFCAISFACFSTEAAFAGSVLVVISLEGACAAVIPANVINEINKVKDTVFILTSIIRIMNYR
ncbi:MAG TPA: hypothetical protein VGO51_03580 [Burkholderiaceae bacterium]|nr:hypothetical protein [Burkholderiaceae bacterium]